MAHQPTAVTVQSTRQIHIPAAFQSAQELGYNDEVKVEVQTPSERTDSFTFKAFVTAQSSLTVPIELTRKFNIESGDNPHMTFEATGRSWPQDFDEQANGRVYYGDEKAPNVTDNRTNTHSN